MSCPMRQAAFKFFANLSAEKRGDLQKYLNAYYHRHTHTGVNIPLPAALGAGVQGAAEARKIDIHEQNSISV